MAIQLIDTVTPDIGLKTVADKLNNNFNDPSHAASRLVGTVGGNVMQVGAFGVGALTSYVSVPNNNLDIPFPSGMYRFDKGTSYGLPFDVGSVLNIRLNDSTSATQIASNFGADRVLVRRQTGGAWQTWCELYHTGNTIVDTNGFIKQA